MGTNDHNKDSSDIFLTCCFLTLNSNQWLSSKSSEEPSLFAMFWLTKIEWKLLKISTARCLDICTSNHIFYESELGKKIKPPKVYNLSFEITPITAFSFRMCRSKEIVNFALEFFSYRKLKNGKIWSKWRITIAHDK